MVSIIQQYTASNLWANQKIADFYGSCNDDCFFKPIENSFPTVKDTFIHIYGAELIWLSRLQGKPIDKFPEFENDKEAILTALIQQSSAFVEFMETLNEAQLIANFHYENSRKENFKNRVVDAIFHCMNHSTYHRGQLVTLSKQLKLEGAPSTDIIGYLHHKKNGTL
jgi:uncharacterized damage-inducible protein DinB